MPGSLAIPPGAISPLSAAAAAAAAAGRVALSGHSGCSGVLLVSNLNEEVSNIPQTSPFLSLSSYRRISCFADVTYLYIVSDMDLEQTFIMVGMTADIL